MKLLLNLDQEEQAYWMNMKKLSKMFFWLYIEKTNASKNDFKTESIGNEKNDQKNKNNNELEKG